MYTLKEFNKSLLNKPFSNIELLGILLQCRIEIEKMVLKVPVKQWDYMHKVIHYTTMPAQSRRSLLSAVLNSIKILPEGDGGYDNIKDIINTEILGIDSEEIKKYKAKNTFKEKFQVISCKPNKYLTKYIYKVFYGEYSKKDQNIFTIMSNTKLEEGAIYNVDRITYESLENNSLRFWITENEILDNSSFLESAREAGIVQCVNMFVDVNYDLEKFVDSLQKVHLDEIMFLNGPSKLNLLTYLKMRGASFYGLSNISDYSTFYKKNYPHEMLAFINKPFGKFRTPLWILEKYLERINYRKDKDGINTSKFIFRQNSTLFLTSSVPNDVIEEQKYIGTPHWYNESGTIADKGDLSLMLEDLNAIRAMSTLLKCNANKPIKKYKREGSDNALFLTNFFYGQAGSGKSSIIKAIIRENVRDFDKFVIYTPTRKAGTVFADIKKELGEKLITRTIQSMDGYIVNERYLYIFDEIGMYNYDWWVKIAKDYSSVFKFMVGDPFQIQPIGSKSFLKELVEVVSSKPYSTTMKKLYRYKKNKLKDFNKIMYSKKDFNKITGEYTDYFSTPKQVVEKITEYKKKFAIDTKKYNEENSGSPLTPDTTVISASNSGLYGVKQLSTYFDKGPMNLGIGDQVIFNVDFTPFENNMIYKIEDISYDDAREIMSIKFQGHSWTNFIINSIPFNHFGFITGHKSQGTTFSNVIVIVDKNVSAEWLYTAISRASLNLMVLISDDVDITAFVSERELEEDVVELIRLESK